MIIIKHYDYGSVSGIGNSWDDNDDSVSGIENDDSVSCTDNDDSVSGIGNSGDDNDANFLAFTFTLTTFR